jgi:hypothetical protein
MEWLNPERAYDLASELAAIPGAPSRDRVIEAMAGTLIRLCHGGSYRGEHWTPERQAEWLVTEACNTWSRWDGPAGLLKIFSSRFRPPSDDGQIRRIPKNEQTPQSTLF